MWPSGIWTASAESEADLHAATILFWGREARTQTSKPAVFAVLPSLCDFVLFVSPAFVTKHIQQLLVGSPEFPKHRCTPCQGRLSAEGLVAFTLPDFRRDHHKARSGLPLASSTGTPRPGPRTSPQERPKSPRQAEHAVGEGHQRVDQGHHGKGQSHHDVRRGHHGVAERDHGPARSKASGDTRRRSADKRLS